MSLPSLDQFVPTIVGGMDDAQIEGVKVFTCMRCMGDCYLSPWGQQRIERWPDTKIICHRCQFNEGLTSAHAGHAPKLPPMSELSPTERKAVASLRRAQQDKFKPASVERFLAFMTVYCVQHYRANNDTLAVMNVYTDTVFAVAREVTDIMEHDDVAAMQRLRAALNKHFAKDFPPLQKIMRQIADWVERKRPPKVTPQIQNIFDELSGGKSGQS